MKFKGNKYKEAILKIKKLPNGSKRRALILETAKTFKVSDKQVYREAEKKPALIGLRDKRSDAGKDKTTISKEMLELFDEYIQQGKTMPEAKGLIEKKLNMKISGRSLTKLSSLVKTQKIKNESNYGSEVKAFIMKALKADMIGFGKTVKIPFKHNERTLEVSLTKQDIEHIGMIIAARYNIKQFSEEKKIRVDDNRLLRLQLKAMVSEEIQKAMETGSLESLDKLSLIQGRLDDSVGAITPDFELALIVIQHEFKSAITPEELLSLMEKYKEEVKNG